MKRGDGQCLEQSGSGSNRLLAGNGKDKLESAYKEPIRKIVAVVTPFKAQEEIIRSLAEQSPEAEAFAGMTIGTVHSLQGAQCPVVIFSSVNSPGDASFLWSKVESTICSTWLFRVRSIIFWCSGI